MSKRDQYKDPRGHHIRLYSEIFDSPAFKSLGPFDVLAYLSLRRDLKSTNNGDLSMTLTKSKERGIKHHLTLARSLRALCAVGLILMTRKGGSTKGGQRLPNLYAFTDEDVYENSKKYIDARRATNAWKSVRSIEHGQQLIAQAEAKVKEYSKKSKSLGHGMTGMTSPDEVIIPINGTPHDAWIDEPRHAMTYGENAETPVSIRSAEQFIDVGHFSSHRTHRVPPIHIAIPKCCEAVTVGPVESTHTELGNYIRLSRPVNDRGWLPEGLVQREVVPAAVTKKAQKLLAKTPRGANEAVVIQAGRSAGLSLELLHAWSDGDTLAKAIAANAARPWQDLWKVEL